MVKKLKLGKLTPIFEFLTKNLKNRTISTFFLFFFFFFFTNTWIDLGHFYKKKFSRKYKKNFYKYIHQPGTLL